VFLETDLSVVGSEQQDTQTAPERTGRRTPHTCATIELRVVLVMLKNILIWFLKQNGVEKVNKRHVNRKYERILNVGRLKVTVAFR